MCGLVLPEVLMPERLGMVYEAPKSPRGGKAPNKGELLCQTASENMYIQQGSLFHLHDRDCQRVG